MKIAEFRTKYNTVAAEDINSLVTDESKPLVEAAEKAVRTQIGASLRDYMGELGTDLGIPVVREQTDSELAKQIADLNKQIKTLEGQLATGGTDKAKVEKDLADLKSKHEKLEGDSKDQKRRADVKAAIEAALKDSDYQEIVLKVATEGDAAPINLPDFDKAKAEKWVAAKVAEYDAVAEKHSGNTLGEVDTGSLEDEETGSPFVSRKPVKESAKGKKEEPAYAL